MDIKIGAVFSLAGNEEEQNTEGIKIKKEKDDDHEYVQAAAVNDYEDQIEDDQWPIDHSSSPILHDQNISSCADYDWDTESAVSDTGDPDCPPFLSIEPLPDQPPAVDMDWQDDALPPVLQPEEINTFEASHRKDEQKPPVKRKCQKILPSYLALTNVGSIMRNKEFITMRQLKRVLKECSNMCKKHHFRRRLEAGKDVFNVLTPSRQRPYQLYLQKQGDKRKMLDEKWTKTKLQKSVPNLASLLAFHDKLKEKKKTPQGRKPVAKVRRVIHTTPNDFKLIQQAPNKDDYNDMLNIGRDKIDITGKAYEEKMQRLIHRKELNFLKSQIKWKRISNKQTKKLRQIGNVPIVNTLAAGTSSKGRKRKCTSKYNDFFLSKTDEAHIEMITRINNWEQRLEKEQKRRKNELERLRKWSFCPKTTSDKLDVVIDNPKNIKMIKIEKSKISSGINFVIDEQSKTFTEYANTTNVKDKLNISKPKVQRKTDKVLIRDMPNENQVISDFLQDFSQDKLDVPAPTETINQASAQTNVQCFTQTGSSELYPYAKSLLKTSLLAKQEHKRQDKEQKFPCSVNSRKNSQPYPTLMAPDLEIEKCKKLRIPEKVQNLFKIKTEAIDNDSGYGGYMPATTCSSVSYTKSTPTSQYVSSSSGPVTYTSTSILAAKQQNPATQPSQLGSPSSEKKRLILPAPTFGHLKDTGPTIRHVLLQNGAITIPVALRSGLTGDKIMTFLPSEPLRVSSKDVQTGATQCSTTLKPCTTTQTMVVVAAPPHAANNPVSSTSTKTVFQQPNPTTIFPINPNIPQGSIRLSTVNNKGVVTGAVNDGNNKNTNIQVIRQSTPIRVYPKSTQSVINPLSQSIIRGTPLSGNVNANPNMKITGPLIKQVVTANPLTPATPSHITTSLSTANTQGLKGDISKFYLLKVDNKSILIPMQAGLNGTPPTAFVVNDPVTTSKVLSSPVAGSSSSLNTVQVSSPMKAKQLKPTAAITPSMKPTGQATSMTNTDSSMKSALSKPAKTALKVVDLVKLPAKPVMLENKSFSSESRLQKTLGTTYTTVNQIKVTTQIGAIPSRNTQNGTRLVKTGASTSVKNATGDFVLKTDPHPVKIKEELDDLSSYISSGPGTYSPNPNPTVAYYTKPTKSKIELNDKDISAKSASKTIQDGTTQEEPCSTDLLGREEKLRKLKELLKERQKAVDDLRAKRDKPPE